MKKTAFIDRDGTLIFEPPDTMQIDSVNLLQILPGVVDGLKNLRAQGFSLVMVSNQNGIGTKRFPKKNFEAPQKKLLEILKKEGIEFDHILICPHLSEKQCRCRKPKTGLVRKMIKIVDVKNSLMIGDRETDFIFAKNLGLPFFRMGTNSRFPRIGIVQRTTKETDIKATVNLDGTGTFQVDTGLGFFNHMLEQFSKHSLINLTLNAKGDLQVDEHHTVEDTAIVLGEALKKALGDKIGIRRYSFILPMDDTLTEVAIDLGGRPYLVFNARFKRERVGDLPTELVKHFFRSLADSLKANIHINVRYSENEHHIIESIFKAFARAMRTACEEEPRMTGILPSTKGKLT